MHTFPDYAITLRPDEGDHHPVVVGTCDGDVISDDHLRARCPTLGRVMVLLRRMRQIMIRTSDNPQRRAVLLNELAEWFWNPQVAGALERFEDYVVENHVAN